MRPLAECGLDCFEEAFADTVDIARPESQDEIAGHRRVVQVLDHRGLSGKIRHRLVLSQAQHGVHYKLPAHAG